MNKTERQHVINQLLRERWRITLHELQQETGASRATLMRDIAWLRHELGCPIHWDAEERCYRWRPQSGQPNAPVELAGLWFTPDEVLALLSMEQLLAQIQPGDLLQRQLRPVRDRLQRILHTADSQRASSQLSQRVRIIGLARRGVRPHCFETVGLAMSQRQRLHIRYLARGTGQASEREVSPQRLVHYRSNWYLDAWCHERESLRSFSLDAIAWARVKSEPAIDLPEEGLDAALGAGYGIFSGAQVQWATLRFSAERARWVAAEEWHWDQAH